MTNTPYNRILVTGGTGFLGTHVVKTLRGEGREVTSVGSADYDFLESGAAEAMIKATRPDAIIHLAAKVGGIIANKEYPADFFDDNIIMNTSTLKAAHKLGVPKFLTFIGGCSYPGTAPSPINEDDLWSGYPQKESAAYSTAKKMMVIQANAYREQHGYNAVVVIPGNVYGEYDNFNEEYSHVIPALIRRFHEAKEKARPSAYCYGSGRPTRDFVYAGDVAAVTPWFLDEYDSPQPVNISSGTRTSIRELAETVKEVIGYPGTLDWDTSKPDGQIDKIFDVTRLKALGLSCATPLSDGLRKTADWYVAAHAEGTVRL